MAGLWVFLHVMSGHIPIERWLFWTFAEIWLCILAFGAACLSAGDLVLTRWLKWVAPLRERLLMAFAVGVVVFQTGVFVAGLFHGLGTVFFVGWPVFLMALRGVPLLRVARRGLRVVRAPQLSWYFWPSGLAALFGLGGLCLTYVNILTPANVSYDARWYHLALAEHYVAAGAITRFPEGWFNGSLPHLASLLYTWAFLIPNGGLFARIELAAHLEFAIFLVTMGGIALLARWCAAQAGIRIQHAWAAVFLFPGILLYDSSLSCGADHVLAFWAPCIFLALRRTLREWDARSATLLGVLVAGALLTKYQGVYLCAAPGLAMLWAAWRRGRRRRGSSTTTALVSPPPPSSWTFRIREALLPVGASALALALVTTPLWLRNWIWYGDPVYPLLPRLFSPRPWVPGTDPSRFLQLPSWTPQGTLFAKLEETLMATVQFSFIPHDWENLHADVPVFGSLFTLFLPVLLFIQPQPRRRLLGLAGATWLGLCVWYWTYHQDRYLQALVPWMAAFLAGILAIAWQRGWAVRSAVVALVFMQIVWGGDTFAIPTHAMIGEQPAKRTLDMLSASYRSDWAGQRNPHQDLEAVGRVLPPHSKVLVHERLTHLGLEAMSVADSPGTQGAISYRLLATPRRVHDLLQSLGVTHLLWRPNATLGWQTLADDLVFLDFVENDLGPPTAIAGMRLAALPTVPPPENAGPRLVRVATCHGARTLLLEQVDAFLAGVHAVGETPSQRLPDFLVTQTGCSPAPSVTVESKGAYRLAATRPPYELWLAPRAPRGG